ncbi:MAG: T9SS type A sorting domain-containing protein [Parafilimonas sp.]
MKKSLLLILLFFAFGISSFANISQQSWRWRNNNGSETSATWKAAENQGITIGSIDSILRLRIQLQNTTGDTKGFNANLQVASAPDGPWRYVTNYDANNPFKITMVNTEVTDLAGTTQQLSSSGYPFASGKILSRTNELNENLTNNTETEYEYSIQPTENIDASTTYYFKIPGADYPIALPTVTTTANINSKQKIISNGSFESDMKDWIFSTQGSAQATSNIIDSIHKDGLKTMLVNVATQGNVNDIKLQHNTVALNAGHVYLVHFWARADKRSAQMRLVVNGSTKTLPYDYKLYTSWEEFQFAFKAADANAVIGFNFTTATNYFIDKVEILDENNSQVDVPMNYIWQNNRPENEYSWLSADGQISQPLPDGRTVWTFSDGWYGNNDTTTNSMNTHQLIRNTFVTQTAAKPNGILHTTIGGTVNAPKALMTPPDPIGYDDFFWPRDMIVENDSLKILLPDTRQLNQNDDVTYGNREAIGIFSLPDLTLHSIQWMPYIDSIQYTTLCQADDGYTYAYGVHTINAFESHAIVARFPTGQLSVNVPWKFLTDTGWSYDYHNSKEIADVNLYSVTRLGINNYIALFMTPLSDKVEVEYAQSPVGPWVGRSIVGQTEGQADILSYFALIHEETADNGTYSFSYCNIGDISQMLDDKTVYWPTFQKANLKSLSPFSDGVLASTLLNFYANADDKKVLLQWETATETNNDHFIIQRSANGSSGWSNIATIKSKGNSLETQSYSTYDIHPFNGDNYYRLIQFDKDGNTVTSAIKLVTIKLAQAHVKIYPNPANGNAFITLENYAGNTIHITVTDINGRNILSKNIEVTSNGNYKIPFVNKPVAGIYSVAVSGTNLNNNIKLVIQ